MDNLLVALHNLKALLNHIHVLIYALTHGKDTSEHLQDARVGTRGGGSTTIAGSTGRSGSWSGGASTMSPWILGHYGAKRVMAHILVELLTSHHLNHVLNLWCKFTRSEWVSGNVPNLIHDVLKQLMLHECIQ
jgi:hypothetical protein